MGAQTRPAVGEGNDVSYWPKADIRSAAADVRF